MADLASLTTIILASPLPAPNGVPVVFRVDCILGPLSDGLISRIVPAWEVGSGAFPKDNLFRRNLLCGYLFRVKFFVHIQKSLVLLSRKSDADLLVKAEIDCGSLLAERQLTACFRERLCDWQCGADTPYDGYLLVLGDADELNDSESEGLAGLGSGLESRRGCRVGNPFVCLSLDRWYRFKEKFV